MKCVGVGLRGQTYFIPFKFCKIKKITPPSNLWNPFFTPNPSNKKVVPPCSVVTFFLVTYKNKINAFFRLLEKVDRVYFEKQQSSDSENGAFEKLP